MTSSSNSCARRATPLKCRRLYESRPNREKPKVFVAMAIGLFEFDLSDLEKRLVEAERRARKDAPAPAQQQLDTDSVENESNSYDDDDEPAPLGRFLVAEACRRYRVAKKINRTNTSHITRPHFGFRDNALIDWLHKNPIQDPDCIEFVMAKCVELKLISFRRYLNFYLQRRRFCTLFQDHQHHQLTTKETELASWSLHALTPEIFARSSSFGIVQMDLLYLLLRNKPDIVGAANLLRDTK